MTSPSFCTTANERVYITASGCEIGFGGTHGLQAFSPRLEDNHASGYLARVDLAIGAVVGTQRGSFERGPSEQSALPRERTRVGGVLRQRHPSGMMGPSVRWELRRSLSANAAHAPTS